VLGGKLAEAARGLLHFADMYDAFEEGARREDDPLRAVRVEQVRAHARHRLPFVEKRLNGLLQQVEVGRVQDNVARRDAVTVHVDLRPAAAYRRPLGGIEDAVLDTGFVGQQSHFTAQGIEFAHEVAFGQSADGRIAARGAHLLGQDGDQEGLLAHPRRRKRRFNARMAAADDDDIVFQHFVSLQNGT